MDKIIIDIFRFDSSHQDVVAEAHKLLMCLDSCPNQREIHSALISVSDKKAILALCPPCVAGCGNVIVIQRNDASQETKEVFNKKDDFDNVSFHQIPNGAING